MVRRRSAASQFDDEGLAEVFAALAAIPSEIEHEIAHLTYVRPLYEIAAVAFGPDQASLHENSQMC
jgi:hypothetical protein